VLLYGALASNEANHDPIDVAFLTAAVGANISLEGYSQTEFVPFDPKTRMTEATIQRSGETFYVGKGSFSAICSSCKLSDEEIADRSKYAEALATRGLRVICVTKGDQRDDSHFVGLVGIADAVRGDAHDTLEQVRALGISVKMLTGDSKPIARNIAQQVGLGDAVITKTDIEEAEIQGKPLGQMIDDSSVIAEIYPEDKFTIVKALQSRGHVVGMTGDGVNDAPALQQAEVGIAVKNATDIAKDSASAVLTNEGLGEIVSMVKTGRTIYQRIYSLALMMISRKLHIVGYIVVMLFLTHSFMLSIMGTVLMLFLGDFVSMSISTDNVKSSMKPDKFDVSRMFTIGGSLGMLSTIEGAVLTLACLSYFGLSGNVDKIYTFGFAYLNIAGISTLLIVRERNRFWKTRPSNFFMATVFLEILFVTLIAIFGFLELAPIGILPTLAILVYSFLVSFFINDPVKVYLTDKFKSSKSSTSPSL
jgi:H+-transporting ATPase